MTAARSGIAASTSSRSSGRYPYENVWGLLVDDDIESKMPDPEPYEPARLTGNAPADLQAETARLAGDWKLGKLNEISDEQAREDLGRLSAQMMSIVARSARLADGHTDPVPDAVVAGGKTAAEKFLLRWRGEADPKHVKAIDTYWICTAEHGLERLDVHGARRRVDRRRLRRGALGGRGRALRAVHGGAPAYVKPMLEEVAAMGDAERWVEERSARASASWASGIGSTVPRIRARASSSAPRGARLAADQGRRGARAGRTRGAPEATSGARAGDERRVLLGHRARRRRDPAAARSGDVRVLARRGLVGAHPRAEATGRLFRPSARYIGPEPHALA